MTRNPNWFRLYLLQTLQRTLIERPGAAIFYMIGYGLLFAGFWLQNNFPGLTFEQFLFTSTVSVRGLWSSDPVLVRSALLWCLIFPLGSVVLTFLGTDKVNQYLASAHPGVGSAGGRRWFRWVGILIKAGLIAAGIGKATISIGADDFVEAYFNADDFFGELYIQPQLTIGQTAVDPQNLVTIYVESLELGYGDDALFGRNLIRALEEIPGQGRSFEFLQQSSAGNTISAQVATQCSVPLRSVSAIQNLNDQGKSVRKFLPNVICLGDILASYGYRSIFVQGASLAFAGQGLFWNSHGYEEVFGTEELARIGYPKNTGWGVSDDLVLEFAKNKLQTLARGQQPFNLTVALLDTHHPSGLLGPRCISEGAKTLDEIVECTAKLVKEFLAAARNEGLLDNTRVVVMGDHLAMNNTVYEKLIKTNRKIYNLWIGDEGVQWPKSDVYFNHYDFLPSVLEFMKIPAERRLGLGASIFSHPKNEKDVRETIERMNKAFSYPSPTYLRLWL